MSNNWGKMDKINVKSYTVSNSASSTASQTMGSLYEEIDYSNPQQAFSNSYAEKEKLGFFGSDIACISKEYMADYINRCREVYFNTDKFDGYQEFRDFLVKDKFISKPLRDTGYATQGCCEIDGVVFITSYDTGYNSNYQWSTDKKKQSVLNLADSEGRQKTLYFDNYAHVGGIAYHKESNRAYVPGEYNLPDDKGNLTKKKCINIYDVDILALAKNGDVLIPEKRIWLDENNHGVSTASYLTVNNDNLYAGVFEKNGYGHINKYDVDKDGNLVYVNSITPPLKNVQGMCIYEYNNTEYYVFSSSYGRVNDSTLYIGKLNDDGTFTKFTTINMPCMSEQVSVDESGNLMIVFESDCIKYGDGADFKGHATKQIGNVCYLDMQKIMECANSK